MGRPTLDEFLASNGRNAWLKHHELEVYVRTSVRYLGEPADKVLMFDIPNVTSKRGLRRGAFTRFLDNLLVVLPTWEYNGIYVENVFDSWFVEYLERRGFKRHTEDPGLQSICMYLLF